MADYSAGNLELKMTALGDGKAISSIDALITKLGSLQKVLQGITANDLKGITKIASTFKSLANTSNTQINISNIERTFTALSKMNLSVSADQQQFALYVKSLASGLNALSRLPKTFDNISKIDFNKLSLNFMQITNAITPFLDKVNSSQAGLKALATSLKTIGKGRVPNTSGYGGFNERGLWNLGKFTASYYMARRLASTLVTIVKTGSDFTETLNMWQVAFRNNLDRADEFIKKMQKAYGISTETLMRNQAIYKNMLSQMGYVSEEASYQISEALTQMMLDYSSLWNVSIEGASERFKAMLAGQIRPIRNVSGISVEEKAIFDVYKAMGGTKTMRQLTQTEKRLLRIYATFQQMQQSGATGDFAKTIEQFANQSRLMSQYWKELTTWIGIGIKQLIETSGIMQYINALLITATEIVKALVDYDEPNFLDGMFEATEAENEAIDELQGKLLDFDKFRALEDSSDGGMLAIDQKVLDMLSSYNSILDQVENKAQNLADKWLSNIIDENGELTEGAKMVINAFKALGIVLGVLITKNILGKIAKGLLGIKSASQLLNGVLVAGLVWSIMTAIDAFEEGDYWTVILATAIGATLVGAMILANKTMLSGLIKTIGVYIWYYGSLAIQATGKFIKSIFATSQSLKLAFGGVLMLVTGILLFINAFDDMSGVQRAITIIGALAGAITATAIALKLFHMDWPGALSVAGIVAGGILTVSSAVSSAEKYAEGGMPDKGTLFIAGEAGAEIVSTSSSGQTGVANVDQIAQATFRGNMMFWQQAKRDLAQFGRVTISADAEGIFTIVEDTANRKGKKFANA